MSPRIPARLLSAQSDERLVALVRAGHERAFEALVNRYRRPLLRYCRRLHLPDARGEDVLQQSFLQAWQALSGGVEVREVKPWLYRIVHNTAVNVMRRGDEAAREDDVAGTLTGVAGDHHERRAEVREVLGNVAALPSLQREALVQTAFGGRSHDEVASALGVSEGAVRGLLYRARTTLRDAAAALTPPPLLEWALRGSGSLGLTSERAAELAAGGGAVGVTSLLIKGAVVAVTAAAVAGGADIATHRESPHRARSMPASLSAEGVAGGGVARGADGVGEDRVGSADGARGRGGRDDGSGRPGAEDRRKGSDSGNAGDSGDRSGGGGNDTAAAGGSGSGRDSGSSGGSGSDGSGVKGAGDGSGGGGGGGGGGKSGTSGRGRSGSGGSDDVSGGNGSSGSSGGSGSTESGSPGSSGGGSSPGGISGSSGASPGADDDVAGVSGGGSSKGASSTGGKSDATSGATDSASTAPSAAEAVAGADDEKHHGS